MSFAKKGSPRIYLDHNATTPLSPEVVSNIEELLNDWGNPSSVHESSRGPKTILRETRRLFAEKLNVSPLEIIFNSGASEGNNTVLKSVWTLLGQEKNEFIVSSVEHPSIIKTVEYLQTLGAVIHFIPVSRSGQIDIEFIKNKINSKTALISCMYANNETGTIFPIEQISNIAQQHKILFHVDAVQALGKINLNFKNLNIDYATFSAHKFYCLKGCGVLFVKKSSPYLNLIHGGGQERSRRGGTENILAIGSFYKMLQHYDNIEIQAHRLQKLRDQMEQKILSSINNVTVTANESQRLSNTSSLVIAGVDGETLLMSLDLKGFSVSTGAACSSGSPEPSPVLLSMGLSRHEAQNSLRIGLGWSTTEDQVNQFISVLISEVNRIRLVNNEEQI